MSIVTLDFETPYAKGAKEGHPLHKFSLTSLTYEEYILDPRFKVFGCSIKIDDGDTLWYSGDALTGKLHEIFAPGNDHIAVAHNMMFDGAILSWYYGLAAGAYWCTQRMSKAIWNQRPASLAALCTSCYPKDESIRKGDELINFANLTELDEEQEAAMAEYCDNDVNVTFACLKILWPLMPDDELALLDLTLQAFIHPILEIDEPRLLAFLEKYNAETAEIIAAAGVSRSVLASPKQFVAWVKEHLDLDIPIIDAPTKKNPDNKKPALGKDELEFVDFQREHSQYAHIWAGRLRVASTIARSRAERMIRHAKLNGGKLAMPLNYYAAKTGRWGGTNKLNPQNFQRGSEHRRSIVAPDGYQIVVADLSNIEGRLNAWFSDEPNLLSVFAADGCIYDDFATGVFGYTVERKKTAIHPETGEEYEPQWLEGFLGKTCQLGLGYQTGPAKLQRTLFLGSKGKVNFTLEKCQDIVWNEYRGKYSKITENWERAQQAIAQMATLQPGEEVIWRCLKVQHNRIRLPNGMYLNYPGLKVEEDERGRPQFSYWDGDYWTNLYGGKLVENITQALAKIVIGQNMLDIQKYLKENRDRFGVHARVVLTVHDEVLALALDDRAEEVFQNMKHLMSRIPAWANDGKLVLKAEGGWDKSYSK